MLIELSVALNLPNVVHKAVQHPLRIYFRSASQGKAIEPMRVPDIRKYGLDDAEPAAIRISADIRINLALHSGAISLRFALGSTYKESHLSHRRSLWMANALHAKRAMTARSERRAKANSLEAIEVFRAAAAIHAPTRRTKTMRTILRQLKVLRLK